ncbi:MAG: sensor histidine kinase, partial [Lachnospiraceae bacterium]|nr:sensor histidine kinase [Lachnospiraceae bacterium]
IPKLVLQPVVENALLHGIFEKESRKGTIVIMAWEDIDPDTGKEIIVITVSDDGVGMDPDKAKTITRDEKGSTKKGSGIAISNTHQRLVLFYGPPCGLYYSSEIGKGTEVQIKILKQTIEESEEGQLFLQR